MHFQRWRTLHVASPPTTEINCKLVVTNWEPKKKKVLYKNPEVLELSWMESWGTWPRLVDSVPFLVTAGSSVCFGKINRVVVDQTVVGRNNWCSVRPLEAQRAPPSFLSHSGNGFLLLG